jgi:hypothetical protein
MPPEPSLETLIRIQNWFKLAAVVLAALSAFAGLASYVFGNKIDALRTARERALSEEVETTRRALEPRHLSREQAEVVLRGLHGTTGWVFVMAVIGDPEAFDLAEALSGVLRRAPGWRVDGPDFLAGLSSRGIHVLISNVAQTPRGADELVAAFAAARIDVEREVDPAFRPDAFRLVVGHKP